jgi:HAD superfamily hydrolase (TIGR01509 family)
VIEFLTFLARRWRFAAGGDRPEIGQTRRAAGRQRREAAPEAGSAGREALPARDVRAVVFDLDGVILDSEELWNEVREELARERGGRWSKCATTDMMGMSSTEWSRYMHEVVRLQEPPEEINREVVLRMIDRYAKRLPLIDGAVEAVQRVAARWTLGLASSSNRELIDRALDVSGLAQHFHATVSSEEVERGKPAPDVYLETARRLGVEPAQCAAIEDSASGIRSAHTAGMRVVAIPNRAFPPPEDVLESATLVLESISELEPDRLIAATRDSSRRGRSAARSRRAGPPARGH